MLRIELFESCTKTVSVPATNNYLVSRSRAKHHLLKALVSYEVRKDTKGVHAHTVDPGSLSVPELVILVVDVFLDHFVEFASIAKLQSDFSVLVFPQVAVDLVGKVNHLLADFYSNKHVVVIKVNLLLLLGYLGYRLRVHFHRFLFGFLEKENVKILEHQKTCSV